jgi:hypothetical protein
MRAHKSPCGAHRRRVRDCLRLPKQLRREGAEPRSDTIADMHSLRRMKTYSPTGHTFDRGLVLCVCRSANAHVVKVVSERHERRVGPIGACRCDVADDDSPPDEVRLPRAQTRGEAWRSRGLAPRPAFALRGDITRDDAIDALFARRSRNAGDDPGREYFRHPRLVSQCGGAQKARPDPCLRVEKSGSPGHGTGRGVRDGNVCLGWAGRGTSRCTFDAIATIVERSSNPRGCR